MRRSIAGAFYSLLITTIAVMAQEHPPALDLALPTDNDALFRGGGADFYQFTERDFKGVMSTPWEGGQYGFVRDPRESASGIVYRRFHEGIDIVPLHRDARGEPLDEVRAIADGTVVHTNLVSGHSNYGRYVVVEHNWGGSNYYSLYGHLSSIGVKPGQAIRRSERLGVMGYTGAGLSQIRAHLHLELNLMLNRRFESWYDRFFKNDPNRHGIYSGINLIGIDIARLYLELRKRPSLTIPEFLSEEETVYKIALPKSKNFDLAKFYPWMVRKIENGDGESWEVSFNRAGVPLRIQEQAKRVSVPEVSYLTPSSMESHHLTREVVKGRGERAHLTESGKRFAQLLIWE